MSVVTMLLALNLPWTIQAAQTAGAIGQHLALPLIAASCTSPGLDHTGASKSLGPLLNSQ